MDALKAADASQIIQDLQVFDGNQHLVIDLEDLTVAVFEIDLCDQRIPADPPREEQEAGQRVHCAGRVLLLWAFSCRKQELPIILDRVDLPDELYAE